MNRLISIALVCLLQVSLAVASTFNLRVEVTLDGSGSLNTNGGTYEEGSSVYLRTYANTGYVFKGWYEGKTLLSSATGFTYTMPSNDALVQAIYEYDPAVPGNPAMPDTTTYYSFTASVAPVGAGSLNTYSGKYAAGASVNMRTYGNTGYQFIGWQNENGENISSSTSFRYTMPYRDVQLTALYVYDPSVPANPDSMATQYTVNVDCKPVGGGTFNTWSATAEEGGNVHLYAYTNTGYRFLRWENELGEIISTAQNFYYVIPHGNSKVFGIFEFDPAVPGNPNKNYWNKDLGEVIVDDFTPGNLGSAVSSVINSSSRNDVAMITVAGRMNDNDFGIANDYTNCTLLDLSRVTGITQVPSYAFDYTNLESVYLPATIEKIGYRAFYECKQLSSLIIYAMMPPTLENDVFTKVPDGLVVYVPAGAIGQYQDSEAWSKFTILPIQEDLRSISVSLPKGAKASDYAKMWLELTNTKSGQRMHYIMTERDVYTFANIIKNTSWNVVLRNERGDVFGKIDNVEVKDEDVSVSFVSLTKPQTISLAVQTPDGKDVTGQTQITWTDGSGNYIAQGTSLSALPVGYQLNYSVALSQDLAMLYDTPKLTAYTLKDGSNSLTCKLQNIKQVQITGKVKDVSSGLALSGAVVSASQTFGGKYSKTINGKTDANGVFTLTVANVPTSLAFAATDYISQSVNFDNGLDEINELGDVALKPISGATITVGFNYTTVDGETQNWYSDYQNVGYTLYNKTRKQIIGQFNVQYPQIVLLEEVSEGDVLELTAESKMQSFMPVKATATISADQSAEAQFSIVELGQLKAEYSQSGNVDVVASLYDSNGKLLKTYDYQDMSLTVSNLADGKYTLVSMGSSQFFNSIYDLAQLPQTGLKAGTDYVQNAVTVKSGKVTTVHIDLVPKLDESKLYYTGDNTSFTVNKPSIVAGNYLTLTGRIDFKQAYAANVSNVQMIIDLPESCEFVENSVMVGNSTSSYTLNGHQLIIPMARYTDRVRFCVIPTLGGDYSPSAFAQFDLNGKSIKQPMGSANYTAKDLSIFVPSTVAKTSVPISGTAIGASSVVIFDNGVLIGQTTSLANGTWATTCELNDPYNLSTHSITAKVTTKAGIELQSESKELTYDKSAIQVQKVTMYHDNPEQHKTYEVVFDFLNPSEKASTYVYYIYNKEFTFTIDFTNNDPEKVSNVILYVKTGKNGKWTSLKPTFDETKKTWVASGQFGNMYDGNIPVNVKVGYDVNSEPVLDVRLFDDVLNLKDGISEDMDDDDPALDDVIARYDAAVEAGNDEFAEELLQEMMSMMGYGEVSEGDALMDEDELHQLEAEALKENELLSSVFSDLSQQSIYLQDSYKEYMDGVTIEHAPDVTPEQLVAKGYEAVQKTDNTFYYVLLGEDAIHYVDFSADIHVIMTGGIVAATRGASDDSGEQWLDKIRDLCMKVEDGCSKILGVFDDCVKRIGDAIANNEKLLNEARKTLANKKKLGLSKSEVKALNKSISKYSKNIKHCKKLKKVLNNKVRPYIGSGTDKFSKVAGKGFTLFALAVDAWDCYKQESKLVTLHKSISAPCEKAESAATSLKSDVKGWIVKAGIFYAAKIGADIAELAGFSGGIIGLIPSGGSSLTAILAAAAVMAANIGADLLFNWRFNKNYDRFCKEYRELYKLCDKEPCDGNTPCPPGSDGEDENDPQESGNPDSAPQIDPSGFVYEGVFSNRVEGATATVYYKETVEDMYGDLHENIVKWDAEEYAQENPLFTDENGYYRWDVPQGLWQVKFEKEGYETTYSEWLPVPPPQLDINIPMKQNRQPEVKSARAFKDAVELEFDKYMQPELLTTENITVMSGNKAVEGTIKLLNEEVAYEGETETFASKVRFNATKPFDGKEVTLMVSNRVKSYAGIRMQDDFSQQFTVEEEVSRIDCKEGINVVYGQNATISVAALPASASAGKTLRVKSSSAMILSTDAESIVLDKNGKAEIKVHGELPGTAALTFSVDGYDLTATTTVNVVTILLGDVNGDGEVNAADIVVLQNYLSGQKTVDIDESAADADGDGSITDGDVLAIVAIILNKR